MIKCKTGQVVTHLTRLNKQMLEPKKLSDEATKSMWTFLFESPGSY